MKKPWYDRLHERFALSSLGVNETKEDIDRWMRFLRDIPEAKNCYELAYNRYRCRMYYFSRMKRLAANVLGFGAFFVELACLLIPGKPVGSPRKGHVLIERARDIPDFTDIAPKSLFAEYSDVEAIPNHNEKFGLLCREAKKYLLGSVRAHPFSFFFNYFVYVELVAHSRMLLEQNPEITVVYINERNIAGPVLTEMYHSQGRKLYSFMHGEYTLQLIHAFMRFSRYYIWGEPYREFFGGKLRCSIDEYVVYTPGKLERKWDLSGAEPDHFCTYYFSGEDEQTTRNVVTTLTDLAGRGLGCRVRPHPRNRLHIQLLKEVLENTAVEMEAPAEVSLKDSLAGARYVVGLQSTVLAEASVEGKEIVLDDISNPDRYEALKTLRFNVFSKEHRLLSELVHDAVVRS